VPREFFTTVLTLKEVYSDAALPSGLGETIFQPYMVGWMIELLAFEGFERVMEVGTGLGYQAAVLSRMARQVVKVERLASHAEQARQVLHRLGYENVEVVQGDGSLGHPPRASYDAIVVAAAAPSVPAA